MVKPRTNINIMENREITDAVQVISSLLTPVATGNVTFSRYRNAALLATPIAVKASAGAIYGISIYNPNDEVSFVKLYNIAQASVTVGTSAVYRTWAVAAGDTLVIPPQLLPLDVFSTAITVAATKLLADNDTTAPDVGMAVQITYL